MSEKLPIRILRDGQEFARAKDADDAFVCILQSQGQSVDYALRWGGWRAVDEAGNDVLTRQQEDERRRRWARFDNANGIGRGR